MYGMQNMGIDGPEDISLDDIVPRDSDTNEILTGENMPEITNLEFMFDTLIFDASHFTTFELQPFLTSVNIISDYMYN